MEGRAAWLRNSKEPLSPEQSEQGRKFGGGGCIRGHRADGAGFGKIAKQRMIYIWIVGKAVIIGITLESR